MFVPLNFSLYRRGGKRAFDIAGASLLLFTLAPLLCLCGALVAIKLGRPITFCQHRLGKDGRIFLMHKFRSMSEPGHKNKAQEPDRERTSSFGRLLRSTSLDELPQLFDILRGEMSLVGPRPLLTSYRNRYTKREWSRHYVRPGITGWCQVNGRNALDWDTKLELDAVYVEKYSFWFDLKILFMTIAKVCRRQGISAPGEVSMPELRPDGLAPELRWNSGG